MKDGRTTRAVLTRYRRRRLVKLGYACPVRSGCDRYPETLPDCTVTIDDEPAEPGSSSCDPAFDRVVQF